ncbi:MAG: twin-arginine translocase subunit TatC [Leptospiraceae bacterium]|nr:twin-arginine translocase subunit TatC [Leptospiraceae bacterium]MDW7975968.1 twin-arginine translocase subunit TatC [Leptospiraceae bacterium]
MNKKSKRKVVKTQKATKVIPEEKDQESQDEEEILDPREKYMTIGDHLEELRKRIFAIIGVWLAASIFVGIFSPYIHSILVQPYREYSNEPLILGTVYGPLEIYFKLSLILGFIIALPISLAIMWGFITPAVSQRAATIGYTVVISSAFLFWLGVWFAWKYLFPLSLRMMFQLFLPAETVPQTSIEKYYSFLFFLLIGTGATFQLPLVVILLGFLEILTLEWHKKAWKFIVVSIFFFSAFITPPDPFSMFVMAFPLLLLYGVSVGIVWLFELRRKRY